MGQALYRKYRSRSLKEIIGQEHITDTLERALKQGRISHAYLFTGPRGVGKTSIARILAHEINGLPYTDDSTHLDIIEIDAASNRRIDEIRDLREKVHAAPTSAKYKVYIIDEVHMLTKEAFNALLKTLEEPPAHAVFILATTDAHKLPDTIVSRTQRFTFKPVDTAKVAAHLADIANREKIKISPEALELLARHGEGSFRDSISLLDQLASHTKQIDADDVRTLLGVPSDDAIDGLLQSLGEGGSKKLAGNLESLLAAGYQPAAVARQISKRLRAQLIGGKGTLPTQTALGLLEKMIDVPVSHDPERFLEVVLLDAQASLGVNAPQENEATEPLEAEQPKPAPPKPEANASEPAPAPSAEPPAKKAPPAAKPAGDKSFDEAVWPAVLQTLKQKHNTLYGVVRMAQPTFLPDDTLELAFAFAFHEKRIREASNRKKLADVIYELTGKTVTVECRLDTSAQPPKVSLETVKPTPPKDLAAISNIFGAAELLES